MVFEGVMMLLACLCLTVWHPGWVIRGGWEQSADRAQDTEGRELMGLDVGGKMDGVGNGARRYVNIDVGQRNR